MLLTLFLGGKQPPPPVTFSYRDQILTAIDGLAVNRYGTEGFSTDPLGRVSYERDGLLAKAGIDVSFYQGEIDWQAVAADGVDFALIRLGYRGYTEGGLFLDSFYKANIQGALEAGLEVGVYFFSQAITEEEAREETMRMLNLYADFMENVLAMPVVRGRKTDKEKFNGAEETYTVECMMHDRKALQAGTSHYFGDGFARAFDITFTGRDNQLHYPHQTSWGVSTRMIGGIIMTHGDNNGLVLPPRIAPIQAMVIPVAQHKEGVLEAAAGLRDRLTAAGIRVSMDDSDQSAGWKFAQYEMKGVPLRVEIGPKDMEKGQCCIARRDTGEKTFVPLTELESAVQQLLQDVHDNLYAMAEKNLEDNTFDMTSWEEVKEMAQGKGGFARTKWCGSLECELAMKEKAGVSSRCMPLKQSGTEGKCVMCGKPATTDIYWGVAY